jgi:secreted Zn-dependent insulinase-like peptidase
MVTFESDDYVRGNHLFQVFDEEIITDVIERLNEGKFNLIILDASHKTFNMRDKYYETEYDEIDFPEKYRKLWNERKPNPKFFLEMSNPYKPEKFEIFENEEESPVSLVS